VRLVARVQGDGGDGLARKTQLMRGPLQPQPAHVFLNRFPHHAPEDAVEMVQREVRYSHQFVPAPIRLTFFAKIGGRAIHSTITL